MRYVPRVQRAPGNPISDGAAGAQPHRAPAIHACVLATGRDAYYRAARGAVRSILRHTPFDILVAVGERARWRDPHDARVHVHALAPPSPRIRHRAGPFLEKFRALDACLRETDAERILLLDGDTRMVARIGADDVEQALAGRGLAMAEQTTIRRSGMSRADFREHYVRHSLAWLGGGAAPPSQDAFRYFNSGVVLARRDALAPLVAWALERMHAAGDAHQAGEHMIADQDYFQLWANTLHPGSCSTLSWHWNHCEHWDDGFPRAGARIVHASNFCLGPRRALSLRLAARLALSRVGRALRAGSTAGAGR